MASVFIATTILMVIIVAIALLAVFLLVDKCIAWFIKPDYHQHRR